MKTIIPTLFFIMTLTVPVPGICDEHAAPETVVLRLKWYHQFQFAGYYAAQKQGFYREAGLSVEIREGESETDAVKEVCSGRADYGVSNSEVLLRRLRGDPVVVIAVIFQHSPLVFVTAENSGIRHPHDMIGRRIGFSQSTRDAELLAMLQNEGVSPDAVRLPDGGKCTLTMHYDGTADASSAYLTNEPFHLEQKNIPYRIIHPLYYGIDFYGDCLITSERELAEHPERVRAFREASLRGWEFAMSHQEEMTDYILRHYGKRKTREHLLYEARKMEELIHPKLIEMGHMNPGRWRHIADTFVKLKMADPGYSLEGFLYDPNPHTELARFRKFITVLLLILLAVGIGISVLLYFNRRLQNEVRERKHAEKQLRFQAELMDQIQDFIVATDTKGRITYINNAVARFLGQTGKSPIGKSVYILSKPDEFQIQQEIIEKTLAQGSWKGKVVNYAEDGSPHTLETRTWVTRDPAEGIVGMVGLSTDITEREHMSEKLRRAVEAAEAASQAKSEFLANMSHEIRTPMNAILGFSEILLNKTRNTQDRHYLTSIHSSGQVLLSLINDILDLSKIEAGKLEIRPEPVNIRNLFKEVRTVFFEKFRDKKLEFRTEVSEELPGLMMVDEVRMRQILINLVGNALKFTSAGFVQMSAYPQMQENNCPENCLDLVLEVEDTGIGIPQDQHEVIFESFQQQKGQSSAKYGGTGLGLTITRRLTEMMKGSITVESEPGKGSLFRLLFCDVPMVKNQYESEDTDISESWEEVAVQFASASVLAVDDGLLNRELIRGYLEGSGLSVMESENGEHALGLLRAGNIPDLILMDLRMPGRNGYEITEILRNDMKYKKIPVIACTAGAMKKDEKRIAELFDGLVRKPLEKRLLVSELKRFLPHSEEKIPVMGKKEFPEENRDKSHAAGTGPHTGKGFHAGMEGNF